MTAVEAALAGATVITSSKRLSRVLTQEIQRYHRAAGQSLWRTPPILPFDAFVRKCFDEWLYSGRAAAVPTILNPVQEEAAWEQIILSADGDRLLQPYATARAAKEAWELAVAWRISLNRASFAVSEDSEAFHRWASRYREKCREQAWLDSARLADFVRDLILRGEAAPPSKIVLAGFDELTPQQRDFVGAIRGCGESRAGQLGLFSAALRAVEECAPVQFTAAPTLLAMRDAAHELASAAERCREILIQNPAARIGVIVPRLRSMRARADRIFGEILHPGAFAEGDQAYHISAGRALAEYPIIGAALLLLETGMPTIPLSTAGLLLRSPFVSGAGSERDARAMADLRMRRHSAPGLTLDEFQRYTSDCPRFEGFLRQIADQVRKLPDKQPPSSWSRTFARLLNAAAWPGDRPLKSYDLQTTQAWNRALSALATTDCVVAAADYEEALLRLRRIVSNTTFQPENEGAAVQILGSLEAAGLTFDHIWIAGLDDETVPSPASPNPFLPLPIQVRLGMPHSSARRELDFARLRLERLISSAPEVTLSYARSNGEKQLHPSPLLGAMADTRDVDTSKPLRRWFEPASLEELADQTGPPLESETVKGGSRLLKTMAECPFKAFAAFRLNAGEMEDSDFGFSASERGRFLHKAMELVWNELRSHEALIASTPEVLGELVARSVAQAVSGETAMHALERDRLRKLILRWLDEVERVRRPFTVEACEKKDNVVIGNLGLEVRVDRIDRLADGRLAILDYKTTRKIGKTCWEGERLAEPQLPLYAATCPDSLGAVQIARLRRDELKLLGLADGNCFGFRDKHVRLPAALAEWKRVLPVLAEQFRAGVATVDPLKKACEFCRFTALCRVHDADGLPEENDNAAE